MNESALQAGVIRKAEDYQALGTFHADQHDPTTALVFYAASLALAGLAAVMAETEGE